MANERVSSGSADANAVYPLGSQRVEKDRLLRQAAELAAANATLVDRAALPPGAAAIDLGCGPFGILDILADRVGPQGRVVGLDADPSLVAMPKSW